ncbi:MAG TPA: hypothetical protein VFX20_17595 [Steroidobacteraceae bacterium]|nr:hypothetical protein [Steroidobacteraceae bacterium]
MSKSSFLRQLLLTATGLFVLPIATSFVARAGIANGAAGRSQLSANPSSLEVLHWRLIGPFHGGISPTVAGDPSNPYVFYLGSVGGGVWRTQDAGVSWQNMTDGFLDNGNIGAIAIAQSNPRIIYVGTGESTMRNTTVPGDGMWRSVDGGKTWRHIGLERTHHIARIVIDPANPDRVYVAAFGHAYGPNPDRGVYRSDDGGLTWEKVLYEGPGVGAIDLAMDPHDSSVLYAAMWQARNYPWSNRTAGPRDGLYKTTDGGAHWTDITNNPGLPKGLKGRIGVAVSAARPGLVWTIMTAEGTRGGAWPPADVHIPRGWQPCLQYTCQGNGLYRSDDGGATWHRTTSDPHLFQRPWYFGTVIADPKDPNTVYVPEVGLWRSIDGGRTMTQFHSGDSHDLWIDPANPRRMIAGTDNGASVTVDGGRTWSSVENQPTGQFYKVSTDSRFPYRVLGGQQDHGAISVGSRADSSLPAVFAVGGGEDAVVAADPGDPDITYGGEHHWVTQSDRRTGRVRWVSPWPENDYGEGPEDMKYRWLWWFPVYISPTEPGSLYAAAQVVFRSTDKGQSWKVISPDLTLHDPSTMEPSAPSSPDRYWGPLTRENLTQWYSAISTLAESQVRKGVLWTGSDDGLVYVTEDDGGHWKNVTPAKIRPHTFIWTVEPGHFDTNTAYVAATRYQLGDDRPYLYKTRDSGRSWTQITAGIPPNEITRTIREDPINPGLLYAGTSGGVYVSFNDGQSWQSLQLNQPRVPVWDLGTKSDDLIAATHGRAYWILDGLTVLRQLQRDFAVERVRLFKPSATVLQFAKSRPDPGSVPAGVSIRYFLPNGLNQNVSLSIFDTAGRLIRQFSSDRPAPPGSAEDRFEPKAQPDPPLPSKVGANVFVWDMKYPGVRKTPGAVLRFGDPGGPIVVPGTYRVRLTAGGETQTQTFEVVMDPKMRTTRADSDEQLRLAIRIRDEANEAFAAVAEIRSIRRQVFNDMGRLEETPQAARLHRLGNVLNRKLWSIEDALIQFRVEAGAPAKEDYINWPDRLDDKLVSLLGWLEASESKPTVADYKVFDYLSARVCRELARLRALTQTDLAAFDGLLRETGTAPIQLRYLPQASVHP